MPLTKSDKTFIGNLLNKALVVQGTKFEKSLTNQGTKFEKALVRQEFKFENKLDNIEQKFESHVTKFRDKFYTKIDPILKEVTAKREERTVQADQIKRHEDRIETLEKCCPQNGHLVAPI